MKIVKVIYQDGRQTSVCTTDPMDEEAAERERARIEEALVSGQSKFVRVGPHTIRVDDIIRISVADSDESGTSYYFGDDSEPRVRRDMKF